MQTKTPSRFGGMNRDSDSLQSSLRTQAEPEMGGVKLKLVYLVQIDATRHVALDNFVLI